MKSFTISRFQLTAMTTGLVLLCLGGSGLELSPSVPQVILSINSSFTITCSGWRNVTWYYKREENVPAFHTEARSPTSSVLSLEQVTWTHTGVYVCSENGTNKTREVAVFVPDPEVWFLKNDHIMVTKTREESTIPCLVTDPSINVTLYEKDTDMVVEGSYNPSVGFTAALDDRTYICRGELNGQEKESIPFYVFSIFAPEALEPYINASKTVLKQGETLNVNCTVHTVHLVFFTWDFPNKDEGDIEPLTEVLSSTSMRSYLNITDISLARSGQYVCHVHEGVGEHTASASIDITVLERGFVALTSHLDRNISAHPGENVELKVEIEAYPKPVVRWSKEGTDIRGHNTRQEQETRFVSTLTLVRIRLEQMGCYTVSIQNEDDIKEMTFDLEVKAIKKKSHISGTGGGPPTQDFTTAEELALDLNKGKPVIEGIQGGTATDSGPARDTGLFIQVAGNTLTLLEPPDYDSPDPDIGQPDKQPGNINSQTVRYLYTTHLKRQIELKEVKIDVNKRKLQDMDLEMQITQDTEETITGNPETRKRIPPQITEHLFAQR